MLRLLLNAPNDVSALLARVRALTGEKPPAKKVDAASAMTPATVRRAASSGSSSSSSSSSSWTDGESSVASFCEFGEEEEEFEEEFEEEEAFSPPVTRRQKQEQELKQEAQQAKAADRYAREVANWPLTDQNRKEADDPSPLTWASWDGNEHLILYAPGDRRLWTLRDALRSAQANGHLFYRKVGPLLREEVEVLSAELYGLVEEDEEGDDGNEEEEYSYGAMEAALLARAAKRARRNHGFQSPGGDEGTGFMGGVGGRRYTLRVPTRHCVPDGSGGLYCALGGGGKVGKEEDAEGDGDMAIRRERLEKLARGRR